MHSSKTPKKLGGHLESSFLNYQQVTHHQGCKGMLILIPPCYIVMISILPYIGLTAPQMRKLF
jgi:hypothetical protein